MWLAALLSSLCAFWPPTVERVDLRESFAAGWGDSQNYFISGSIEVPRGAAFYFEIAKTERAVGGAASVMVIDGVHVSATPRDDLRRPRRLAGFIKHHKLRPGEVIARFESEHGYVILYRDLERGSVREHLGLVPQGGSFVVTGAFGRVSCGGGWPDGTATTDENAPPTAEDRAAAERAFRICASYRP